MGDRIATRRNNRDLGVANRDCWTVTGIDADDTLHVHGLAGQRALPVTYVREHVELAFATTVHGAQGETVPTAHFLLGETTGAAAAYVGMTRGRNSNTAHLVADTLEEARSHWIEVFSRDRADLGPGHAATVAEEAIERYGPRLRTTRLRSKPRRSGRPRSTARSIARTTTRTPPRGRRRTDRPLTEVHLVGDM